MALPKIDTPVYDIELPLSKKKLKYRPFLVKEQRNLMMALESEDAEMIETNVKQVLSNCTLTKDIDIDTLPLLDVEYYFVQLRARSVGEVAENNYRCHNMVQQEDGTEKECGNIMPVQVSLLDIKVDIPEGISDTVHITDNIVVKLKYPEFSVMKKMQNTSDISSFIFTLIAESIEYIHDGEQAYYASETPKEEMLEFVENLRQEQFEKLENFFNNLPKLQKTVIFTCKKCGFEHEVEVEGLESFFG